ncbi:MAG: Nif11-like leader peptide family RiPP precursor [Synergistaceae bacterium]|jgi:predicted ribosomally synthesized peptide with nif11-like leader|nr:Nif11-like leader peptide family RiPP precursor [Synergistaceae bacterium]
MGIDEFVEKIKSDKTFAKKYEALTSLDDVLAQAKSDGYSATKEEARKYLKACANAKLSCEDLASVTGGVDVGCSEYNQDPFNK